ETLGASDCGIHLITPSDFNVKYGPPSFTNDAGVATEIILKFSVAGYVSFCKIREALLAKKLPCEWATTIIERFLNARKVRSGFQFPVSWIRDRRASREAFAAWFELNMPFPKNKLVSAGHWALTSPQNTRAIA
ncbi:MAG: hypothetical protein ACXVA9_13700, partial [Bdellovibrionales bacterium]